MTGRAVDLATCMSWGCWVKSPGPPLADRVCFSSFPDWYAPTNGTTLRGQEMKMRTSLAAVASVICGALVVASVSLATGAATHKVTLGSTAGTPSENICVDGIRC